MAVVTCNRLCRQVLSGKEMAKKRTEEKHDQLSNSTKDDKSINMNKIIDEPAHNSQYANRWVFHEADVKLYGKPVYIRIFGSSNVNSPVYKQPLSKYPSGNAAHGRKLSSLQMEFEQTGEPKLVNGNTYRNKYSAGGNERKQLKKNIKTSETHDQSCLFVLDEKFQDNSYEEQLHKQTPLAHINLAKNDYQNIDNFDVRCILEMYAFSPDIVTKDVEEMFKEYIKNGLRIKWVDDTHLLLIFSTDEDAAQALHVSYSTCKLRPLIEASALSKLIAKRHGILPSVDF